ncbi:hypothetical protein PFICI_04697 [Pestalotiopsis fici W106-1]|uniref:Uncharacterized protein n=1 Tax=Pestalotiopsis fici (strain W106-1 / CGMCC3.15140) TaxID=1229662 RepID=W3XCC7_PESFW|nr:uncharacterized protein PFICI_04697 [Pestalotiopsis fici W106-1]ETS82821.1 hypothetical protein PFICI_04697 [Pestalotiopsis fici W106-1]
MSDRIVHQDAGHKLAEDSKRNLGGPGPDQGVTKQSGHSHISQPEADHGKDQQKKVGREQYQDLKDNNERK